MKKVVNVDPFDLDEIDDIANGLYVGSFDTNDEPLDFDLRAVAKYVRENNLSEVTENIKKKFKKAH